MSAAVTVERSMMVSNPLPDLSRSHRPVLYLVAALVVLACLWQQWRLWPLYAEDAFIALRYAENLALGHGLVWNPGEPVEGYSMLLWLLGCAGLIALGLEPVLASRALGVACFAMALLLLLRWLRPRGWREAAPVAIGPMVLALSATSATWMMAGLEGSMVLLLVLAATLSTIRALEAAAVPEPRRLWWPGLAFGLLCLARSDGPLWLLPPCLLVAMRCWRAPPLWGLPQLAVLCGPTVVLLLLQMGWRLWFYGEWLPNTAYLKVEPSAATVREGIVYIGGAFASARGAVALAGLGVVVGLLQPGRRLRTLLLLLPIPLWSAYLVAIGGDYFPSHRMFLPVIGLLAVLAAEGLWWLAQRKAGRFLAPLLGLSAMVCLALDAVADRETAGLRQTGIEWKNLALGRTLGQVFAVEQPLLAVDAAGGIPFGARLPCLDMHGFNDKVIARTPIPELAFQILREVMKRHYMPGHMHGNGQYVMDRAPDLMLFHSAPCMVVPMFLSSYELQQDPRFLAQYRCVQMQCPETTLPNGERVAMRVPMWVRLDGKVGLRHLAGRIDVPAYLLGSYQQPRPFQLLHMPAAGTPERAAFDRDYHGAFVWQAAAALLAVPEGDRLVGALQGPGAVSCGGIEVPAGRWQVLVDPPEAPVAVQVRDPAGGLLQGTEDGFVLATGSSLELVVQPLPGAALPVRLRQLSLVVR